MAYTIQTRGESSSPGPGAGPLTSSKSAHSNLGKPCKMPACNIAGNQVKASAQGGHRTMGKVPAVSHSKSADNLISGNKGFPPTSGDLSQGLYDNLETILTDPEFHHYYESTDIMRFPRDGTMAAGTGFANRRASSKVS